MAKTGMLVKTECQGTSMGPYGYDHFLKRCQYTEHDHIVHSGQDMNNIARKHTVHKNKKLVG